MLAERLKIFGPEKIPPPRKDFAPKTTHYLDKIQSSGLLALLAARQCAVSQGFERLVSVSRTYMKSPSESPHRLSGPFPFSG